MEAVILAIAIVIAVAMLIDSVRTLRQIKKHTLAAEFALARAEAAMERAQAAAQRAHENALKSIR